MQPQSPYQPYGQQPQDNSRPQTPAGPPVQPPSPYPQPAQNQYANNQPHNIYHDPAYDFIVNSGQQPERPFFSGKSMMARIAIFGGGLAVLLILFTIIRGMLSGSSPLPLFVSLTQDQQEIIRLTTLADEADELSTDTENFAATARLSLITSQKDLLTYLTNNGEKVDNKQLNLKADTKTDERLETAAAAATYNETFQEIMNEELTQYMASLQAAYLKTKGAIGRDLLSKQYDQANLLLEQLKATKDE